MKRSSIDILAVIALTLIAIILALLVPASNVAFRVLALPLVLVLPGYALTSALFVRQALGITERILFSLAVSLIVVIAGGLLLNLTPFGLQAGSWAVLTGTITLAACAVALARRRGQNVSAPEWLRDRRFSLTFPQGLLLGLAALITCAAVALSIIGAQEQPYPGFTQLWILPASGAHAQHSVLLGVKNMEKTAMDYRLVLHAGSKVIQQWSSIDLKPGENWEATVAIKQTGKVGPTQVEAALYRDTAPGTIYRHVDLWLGT